MAIRWLLYSTQARIFGHPTAGKSVGAHPNEENGVIKYLDGSKERVGQLEDCKGKCPKEFQMPLHYPRYKKEDYERMEEWKVDMVLREYGLTFDGPLHEKRQYAIGTFLWPDQI